MARNSGTDTETEVTETTDSEQTAEAGEKKEVRARDLPPDERVSQMYGMPAGLKAKLEEAAEAENISAAAFTRNLVAKHFEYELPASTRGGAQKKYASDEEREAARKSKGKQRRDLIRNLLAAYEKNPDLQAQVAAALSSGKSEDGEADTED